MCVKDGIKFENDVYKYSFAIMFYWYGPLIIDFVYMGFISPLPLIYNLFITNKKKVINN